jgi:hypothetical protein
VHFLPRSLTAPLVGDTLLDVKTVMHARNHHRTADWLQQLLAYTWLDGPDRYRIRHVGLYLARHGHLITWPLDTFTTTLLGMTNPGELAADPCRSGVLDPHRGRYPTVTPGPAVVLGAVPRRPRIQGVARPEAQ